MRLKKITALFLTGALIPVSYTHLDVYKRQMTSSAVAVSNTMLM